MPQVQVNKWVRFLLTILAGSGGLLAVLIAYDWTSLTDVKTAGVITLFFTVIKGAIDLVAPAAGVITAPTGSSTSLITHRAVGST